MRGIVTKLAFAMAALLAVTPAWAQDLPGQGAPARGAVLEGLTGEQLNSIAAQVFDATTLQADSYGDPLILAEADGKRFLIVTHNCDTAPVRTCKTIQFLTYLIGPFTPDRLADLNNYHQRFLNGRAFLDQDNDIGFDWIVNTFQVTPDFVGSHMALWRAFVLPRFPGEIMEGGSESGGGLEALVPNTTADPGLSAYVGSVIDDDHTTLKARLFDENAFPAATDSETGDDTAQD